MDEIVIIRDSNEQRPLTFPARFRRWTPSGLTTYKVRLVREKLPFGDYAPKDFHTLVCMERKYTLRELVNNFHTYDRHRAKKAFTRMVEGCANPYLFLDTLWGNLIPAPSKREQGGHRNLDHAAALSSLTSWLVEHKVRLIGPISARTPRTRRCAGELMLHFFVAHLCPEKKIIESVEFPLDNPCSRGRVKSERGAFSRKSVVAPLLAASSRPT